MSETKVIQKLWSPETLPVTCVGDLKSGWEAGTYVYYVDSSVDPDFSIAPGTLAMVDIWTSREGHTGAKPNRPTGFLLRGSQRILSQALDDADPLRYLTAIEPANFDFQFDDLNQLSLMGNSCATVVIGSTGIFKTYVYERTDSGSVALTYAAADILYVSDNAIWTKETFGTGHFSGYQVANVGTDEEGDYLVITNAW